MGTLLPQGRFGSLTVPIKSSDFVDSDVVLDETRLAGWLGPNGGKLLEQEGRIVAGRAGFEEANAVVAPHSEAGVFVAFKRGAAPPNFASIYVQSFDASGLPRWPGDGVRVANGGGQSNPHLVPDLDGGVYVCWKEGSGGAENGRHLVPASQ